MATMQLILRADVDNLGHLGDTVTVKTGYGRNYLIPQGLAMLATASNMRVFENDRKKLQATQNALRAAADEMAAKINGAVVEIEVRVGESDRLYGSVTASDIADALAKVIGTEVDRKTMLLDGPVKALGKYTVAFKLHPDVTAECELKVYRQGGSAADLDVLEEVVEASAEATEAAPEEGEEAAVEANAATPDAAEAPAAAEADAAAPEADKAAE